MYWECLRNLEYCSLITTKEQPSRHPCTSVIGIVIDLAAGRVYVSVLVGSVGGLHLMSSNSSGPCLARVNVGVCLMDAVAVVG